MENSGKMVINFSEPARELGPLKLTKNGWVKHLQGLRYTNFEKLKNATSLDEVFRNSPPDEVFAPDVRNHSQDFKSDLIGADMKTSYLYIFSLVLLITGFLCIWSAWHGDANITTDIPVGLSSIQLCGSATGSRTLAGFFSGIVGIILYGVALVRTILDEIGR